MKVTVQVGAVAIKVVGLDLTKREVADLLRRAGEIALALDSPDPVEERAPIGFSAPVLDKAGDPPTEFRFTDDD